MPRTSLVPLILVIGALGIAGAGVASLVLNDDATVKNRPDIGGARSAPLRYTGLNLGAGSFGSKRIPAIYGKDYAYPNAREAAPFLAAKMNVVRVPVLWTRIQPTAMAALDEVEMKRLDASFAQLSGFSLIILDVHNYAHYRGTPIGDAQSGALLVDLWTRLAQRYQGNPRIAFGLMNEPKNVEARAWRGVVDQVMSAVRKTGARNLVLVPGSNWTGAHSWTKGGEASNAAAFAGFRDPANNFAFEVHQYLDSDSTGMHDDCISPDRVAARLDAVTAWLKANRAKGFLAEFGAAGNDQCLAGLDALLTRMESAPDAWLGWTYWAGGAWWGSYSFSIQPDKNGAKPQMTVLAMHVGSGQGGSAPTMTLR